MIPTVAQDNQTAQRILRMLTTPFKETEAYKLGIIDAKGVQLKKSVFLNTTKEKAAFTQLHNLVYRLKRVIDKYPLEKKNYLTYAKALILIKENLGRDSQPSVSEFEGRYISEDVAVSASDAELIEYWLSHKYVMSFKLFCEDFGGGIGLGGPTGGGPGGESVPVNVPANNIDYSKGVEKPDPTNLFGKKNVVRRRNKNVAPK